MFDRFLGSLFNINKNILKLLYYFQIILCKQLGKKLNGAQIPLKTIAGKLRKFE